jgi:acyl dehydratase
MTLWFDDLTVGQKWTSPARTITESDVTSFAQLTGDFHPLHTNEPFAAKSRFGQRIAHGLLGLTYAHGLMWTRTGDFDESITAFLGISDWRFSAPVFFGDTIHLRYELVEHRLSRSNSTEGIVGFFVEVLNQNDEVVQSGTKNLLVSNRPETSAANEGASA